MEIKKLLYSETFQQGDIIWVDFSPSRGHEQSKSRPAVVLSTAKHFKYSGLIVVVPITSANKGFPLDVELPTGLKFSGTILISQIKSIDPDARNCKLLERVPKKS